MRTTLWIVQKGYALYDWIFSQPYEKVTHHSSASSLPWFFVGIELTDGTLLDKTDYAQYLVDSGIQITPRTISSSVDQQLVKRCIYLDAKTLKEEEIPAHGITTE